MGRATVVVETDCCADDEHRACAIVCHKGAIGVRRKNTSGVLPGGAAVIIMPDRAWGWSAPALNQKLCMR